MKVRYKFRCYPSDRQKVVLAKEFGCARHAYNWGLRLRTDSYKDGKPVNYNESNAAWTGHRHEPGFEWLRESSSVAQQQGLRNLQVAFSNFFTKRAKYPKFKSKHGKQSASYVGGVVQWDAVNKNLTISKVGRLRVRWSREFTSRPTTVTITKDCGGRYFVTLCLDEPARHALPKTGAQVGIDFGINRLATLSDGTRVANPRHTTRHEVRLAKAQRVLSSRAKGSNRWQLQKLKVAKLHAHIADVRKDALDKLTTDWVRKYDVIATEDLNVRGMVRNHCLAKHIACAGFGMARRMLEYKTAWAGKELRVADRFFPSSKRCNSCGHIHEGMSLDVREWDCTECGQHLDRDENAAKNILQFAKATTGGQPDRKGRGGRVRRFKASASKRNARRNVNQPALVK